mgnify:CR=1 FL=1
MDNATDIPRAADRLLDAALAHVAFDGWSETSFRAAIDETGLSADLARALCPRGAVDLAVAYHRRGDTRMVAMLAAEDLSALRFRDRIARAVRLRIEGADREVIRRGGTLFALPKHAAVGAGLIWGTADAIWRALGDRSEDFNWYTKRATLSAVYAATVLFWLGDESDGQAATWDFLDRRIAGVMRFEKIKARLRESPVFSHLLAGPLDTLNHVRPPSHAGRDLPGRLHEEDLP